MMGFIILIKDKCCYIYIVEASFMTMNQDDSNSFDDDKKAKRMISKVSQQVQDLSWKLSTFHDGSFKNDLSTVVESVR